MHWSLGTQIQKKEREKEGIIKEKKKRQKWRKEERKKKERSKKNATETIDAQISKKQKNVYNKYHKKKEKK